MTIRYILCNGILENSFPYYPRILTDVHNGRDLRIILKNS